MSLMKQRFQQVDKVVEYTQYRPTLLSWKTGLWMFQRIQNQKIKRISDKLRCDIISQPWHYLHLDCILFCCSEGFLVH